MFWCKGCKTLRDEVAYLRELNKSLMTKIYDIEFPQPVPIDKRGFNFFNGGGNKGLEEDKPEDNTGPDIMPEAVVYGEG